MSQSLKTHKSVRQNRSPAFADFMDEVYRRMSVGERDNLPGETGPYVNAIVRYALNHIVDFGEALAEMIANTYVHNPGGERFFLDPTRTD